MEVLAQIPSDLNQLSGWVSLVSSGGFGLLAWYLIAKVIPKQQENDRQDRQATAALNAAAITHAAEQYTASLNKLHDECRQERNEDRRERIEDRREFFAALSAIKESREP